MESCLIISKKREAALVDCAVAIIAHPEASAHELDVNAIAFGRHKAVHDKPFGIGATVYSLLLQQQYSIIVVTL